MKTTKVDFPFLLRKVLPDLSIRETSRYYEITSPFHTHGKAIGGISKSKSNESMFELLTGICHEIIDDNDTSSDIPAEIKQRAALMLRRIDSLADYESITVDRLIYSSKIIPEKEYDKDGEHIIPCKILCDNLPLHFTYHTKNGFFDEDITKYDTNFPPSPDVYYDALCSMIFWRMQTAYFRKNGISYYN